MVTDVTSVVSWSDYEAVLGFGMIPTSEVLTTATDTFIGAMAV